MDTNIKVGIRVRPIIAREIAAQQKTLWKTNNTHIFNQSQDYQFDHVFGQSTKNVEVYEVLGKPLVDKVMEGFNGTLFAYGQTASGKTHTIMGDIGEPGIVPLAIQDVFNIINDSPHREFLLRASYIEIYNEEITDLLSNKKGLKIRSNVDNEIVIDQLTEVAITSCEDAMDLIQKGIGNRKIGTTNMNERSSRSHTIFRLVIESRQLADEWNTSELDGAVIVAQLIEAAFSLYFLFDNETIVKKFIQNLVDLAGSERAAQTGAQGLRLKESGFINTSLMTLGVVIRKLSENDGHVPYRDSKLTRILQNSLGGNARTSIICAVSPVVFDETDQTLKFACRAKTVKNTPKINEILDGDTMMKRQTREIRDLKRKIKELEDGTMPNWHDSLLMEKDKMQNSLEQKLEEQQSKISTLLKQIICSGRRKVSYASKSRRKTWAPGALAKTNIFTKPVVNDLDKSMQLDCDSSTDQPESSGFLYKRMQPFDMIAEESFEKLAGGDDSIVFFEKMEYALLKKEFEEYKAITCSPEQYENLKKQLSENSMTIDNLTVKIQELTNENQKLRVTDVDKYETTRKENLEAAEIQSLLEEKDRITKFAQQLESFDKIRLQNTELIAEKTLLQTKIAELELSTVNDATNQDNLLKEHLDELKEELSAAIESKKALASDIATLKDVIETQGEEAEVLRNDFNKKCSEYFQLQTKEELLQNELKDVKRIHEELLEKYNENIATCEHLEKENQKLNINNLNINTENTAELTTLQEQLRDLQEQNKQLLEETKAAAANSKKLETTLESLQREKDSLLVDFEALKQDGVEFNEEVDTLRRQCNDHVLEIDMQKAKHEEEVAKLTDHQKSLEVSLNKLENLLSVSEDEKTLKDNYVKELQLEKESLLRDEKRSNEMKVLESNYEKLEATYKTTSQMLDSVKNELRDTKTEEQRLHASLTETIEDYEKKIQSFQTNADATLLAEKERLQRECDALQQQRQKDLIEINNLETKALGVQPDKNRLFSPNDACSKEELQDYKAVQDKVNALRETNERITSELEKYIMETNFLEEELETVKKEKVKLIDDLKEHETTIKMHAAEIQSLLEEKDRITELAQQLESFDKISLQNTELMAENTLLQTKIAELEELSTFNDATKQDNLLKEHLDELKEELSAAIESKKALASDIATLKDVIETQGEEAEVLRNDFNKKCSEYFQLQTKEELLQNELKDVKRIHEELLEKYNENIATCEHLEKENQKLTIHNLNIQTENTAEFGTLQEQLRDLQEQNKQLLEESKAAADIATLKDVIETQGEEAEVLRNDFNKKCSEYFQLQTKEELLQNELKDVKRIHEELLEKYNENIATCEHLEKENQKLNINNMNIQTENTAELTTLQEQLRDLQEQNKQLLEETKEAAANTKELETKLESLQHEKDSLLVDFEALKQDGVEFNEEVDTLRQQCNDHVLEIDMQKAKHEEEVAKLTDHQKSLEVSLNKLENLLSVSEDEKTLKDKYVKELQLEKESLLLDAETARKELIELRKNVQALYESKTILEKTIEGESLQLSHEKELLDIAYKRRVDQSDARVMELSSTLRKLKNQNDRLVAENDSYTHKLRAFKDEGNALRKELTEQASQHNIIVGELKSELAERSCELEKRSNEIKVLENNYEKLEATYKTTSQMLDSVKNELRDTKTEVQRLHASLTETIEDYEKKIQSFQTNADATLLAEKERLQRECDALQQQRHKDLIEINNLETKALGVQPDKNRLFSPNDACSKEELQEKIKRLEYRLQLRVDDIKVYADRVHELDDEIKVLEQQKKRYAEHIEKLNEKLIAIRRPSVHAGVKEWEEIVIKLENEKFELEEANAKLKSSNARSKKKEYLMSANVDQMSAAVSLLKEMVSDKNKEIQTFKDNIEEKDKELARISDGLRKAFEKLKTSECQQKDLEIELRSHKESAEAEESKLATNLKIAFEKYKQYKAAWTEVCGEANKLKKALANEKKRSSTLQEKLVEVENQYSSSSDKLDTLNMQNKAEEVKKQEAPLHEKQLIPNKNSHTEMLAEVAEKKLEAAEDSGREMERKRKSNSPRGNVPKKMQLENSYKDLNNDCNQQ